jgi:Fe-S cluster assembly iron-binding protein IscA
MTTVTLTEPAAAKVKELLARDGRQRFASRLVVSGGTGSGLRYPSRFDEHV